MRGKPLNGQIRTQKHRITALARHAVIRSATDSVHSGFIIAAPQERTGLVQWPLPPLAPPPLTAVTRFRATFTNPASSPTYVHCTMVYAAAGNGGLLCHAWLDRVP